ncbi:MAG: zinc-ribbon domain-containing protein [Pseudomonadota bacterium]
MVVMCERCASAFRVDPSKIGPTGANVRCGKCGYVFFTSPGKLDSVPSAGSPPEPTELEGLVSSVSDQLSMVHVPSDPAESAEPAPVPPPPKEAAPREERIPRAPRLLKATPPPLAKAPTPRSRPFVARSIPLADRIRRGTVVTALILLGILFGLFAMGVKPLSRDLRFLLQYGKKAVPREVQILSYRGRLQETSAVERVFFISGEILNSSDERRLSPKLRLDLFAPSGEFLQNSSFSSGSQHLPPGSITPFSAEIDASRISAVGAYQVSIEK